MGCIGVIQDVVGWFIRQLIWLVGGSSSLFGWGWADAKLIEMKFGVNSLCKVL